ncbi:Uncharacterised protein [BD1-7 clade bacterium]|uniref:Uncharacterized protein n=1 Tax=BD1-7 clade bacterium TaxID=2029982 RepID=A0A5S9QG93_9GAMM|nr:Uncharacterised protein [BD1-7 clade bacterium]CAA0117004.1 Uncharacterised protein [BD1-7 clade bacterium]
MISNPRLLSLSDIASEAHAKIQQDFADINPVIGVTQGMRRTGIPADLMTIDCLQSRKRIIVVLHDEQLGVISYQNTFMDQDPGDDFEHLAEQEVTSDVIYQWIKDYFS